MMKALILSLATAGLALAGTAAAAAEPVTFVCTGSRTAPELGTGKMTRQAVAFRLSLDAGARKVVQDGQVMVVRDWSQGRVVYSDYNPGILAALAGGVVTTVDLKTGAWRDKWGSGRCKAEGRTER
jgi:hypothetical protein